MVKSFDVDQVKVEHLLCPACETPMYIVGRSGSKWRYHCYNDAEEVFHEESFPKVLYFSNGVEIAAIQQR